MLGKIALLMDYYNANKAYYEALMTLPAAQMPQWEQANPDAARIIASSISLRKKIRGSGNAV